MNNITMLVQLKYLKQEAEKMNGKIDSLINIIQQEEKEKTVPKADNDKEKFIEVIPELIRKARSPHFSWICGIVEVKIDIDNSGVSPVTYQQPSGEEVYVISSNSVLGEELTEMITEKLKRDDRYKIMKQTHDIS